MTGIAERSVNVDGLDFVYLAAGDTGPLALCLHGFPDSAHSWRHLMARLADAGYRAVAPFQRGFAPTAVPADGRYQAGVLAMDAIALHDALGGESDAVIIGHDWGSPAAYGAACHAPERWAKVVAMTVPPAGSVGAALIGNLAQIKRSWYMFFFQHPIADYVVGLDDLEFIDMLWADWSPGFAADADIANAKACLREPEHLAAALGYYRAALDPSSLDHSLDAVQSATQAVPPQPTLYLHGADDGCVGVALAETARALVGEHVSIEIVEGCGHFLHVERPDFVNDRIMRFLE